nr:GTP cyclohydrolase I FolE [Nocardioides daejeonensis]
MSRSVVGAGSASPVLGQGRFRPVIGSDQRREVDAGAAEAAAAQLLAALGLDLTDENLAETPRRMAHALIEMTLGAEFELTTFPNDEGYDELVMVQDIALQSICEHHMLPFVGIAHIGYLPGERILGLSKFARMVELHARRPQTQERLTKRIADHLEAELAPRGIGVVIEAEHTCMSLRGARNPSARTTTSAMFGKLRDDPRSRAEFLALTRSTR